MMGNRNYYQNDGGPIISILAAISFVMVLAKKYYWLWFTGIGSLAIMTFTFIDFQIKMAHMKSQMESELAGNPFRGLADMAIQSVQLQWGWALLIVGAGLLIASAAIKTKDIVIR